MKTEMQDDAEFTGNFSCRPDLLALVIVISVALGVLRLYGVRHIAFQAAAHVWIGILLGVQIGKRGDAFLAWVTVLLSALEVGAFLFLPR